MPHLLIRDTVLSERRLPLPGRVVVLGRSLDVDVPLPHRSVSRRHALIEWSSGGYRLSDLGSSNGTFVEERRLESGERVELPLATPFRLGEVTLRLVEDEALPEGGEGAVPVGGGAAAVSPRVRVARPPRKKPAPRPPRRPGAWRARRESARWLGVLLTVALLVIAGVFVVRIVQNARSSPEAAAPAPTAGRTRPAPKDRGISPLVPPGRKDRDSDD